MDIQINNKIVNNVKMKLGDNGVAFFVEEIKDDEEFPDYLITSPMPSAEPNCEETNLSKKVSVAEKEKQRTSSTHR